MCIIKVLQTTLSTHLVLVTQVHSTYTHWIDLSLSRYIFWLEIKDVYAVQISTVQQLIQRIKLYKQECRAFISTLGVISLRDHKKKMYQSLWSLRQTGWYLSVRRSRNELQNSFWWDITVVIATKRLNKNYYWHALIQCSSNAIVMGGSYNIVMRWIL